MFIAEGKERYKFVNYVHIFSEWRQLNNDYGFHTLRVYMARQFTFDLEIY